MSNKFQEALSAYVHDKQVGSFATLVNLIRAANNKELQQMLENTQPLSAQLKTDLAEAKAAAYLAIGNRRHLIPLNGNTVKILGVLSLISQYMLPIRQDDPEWLIHLRLVPVFLFLLISIALANQLYSGYKQISFFQDKDYNTALDTYEIKNARHEKIKSAVEGYIAITKQEEKELVPKPKDDLSGNQMLKYDL